MSAGTVVVPLRSGSDGDPTHRPSELAKYRLVDPPTLYLEKLGNLWMESRGEALPGMRYILEKLPDGYALFEKSRISDTKHVDRWLYGHPNRKYFDSANRFWPHFKYLMDNGGDSIGCHCTVCQARGGRVPNLGTPQKSRAGSTDSIVPKDNVPSKPKGRPRLLGTEAGVGRVDEEGTPDVYRNLIDKLKRVGTVDESITEPMSLDWRAEQELLPGLLQKYKEQPQWVPRVGDLILFVRKLNPGEEICRDDESGEFQIYNHELHTFSGYPRWEAGVVGQAPDECVSLEDLVVQTEKYTNVNQHGVRVEPLPDPNGVDKSLSKKYKYVPIHYTRPFVFWKEFLTMPEERWHSTIKNALKCMSNFSLMGKYRFSGRWPSAKIYCHGIYIGGELVTTSDVVRLLPKAGTNSCTDVLQIQYILLKFSNLDKASDSDYDEGRPYNSVVHIIGKGFTLDPNHIENEIDNTNNPSVMDGYDEWFPLHSPTKSMQIPFTRVLGRCFESDAMLLWFSKAPDSASLLPDLGEGLDSLKEGRLYSSRNDTRITSHFDRLWFWGDSRSECLGIDTLNGSELSDKYEHRDPATYRKWIKTISEAEKNSSREEKKKDMIGQRGLRGYLASNATARQSRSERESSGTGTGADGAGLDTRGSSVLPRKKRSHGTASRSDSVGLDVDEEDEDDESEELEVVEANLGAHKKKSKVMVVID